MRELWFDLTSGKTLNGRAVLIVLAGLIAGGAGVFFLHRYQVRRNADGVYEQAKIAEDAGDKALAAHYLQQFLGLEPSHTDALAKLGALLNEQASNDRTRMRVFLMFEQVLRREPERHDIRREVVRLASRLGRFSDGLAHLEVLLPDPAKADDVELLQLRGRCEAGLGNFDEAGKFYKQALASLASGPQQPDIVLEYAALLRGRLKLASAADAVVQQMVSRDPRSRDVRLTAASYFATFGMPKRAWEHLRFTLDELGTPSAETLQLAGEVALDLGEPAEARKLFEQGRRHFPDDERMNRGLAEIEVRTGEGGKALPWLKRSLQDLPNDPYELWRLANILIEANQKTEARLVIEALRKTGNAGMVALLEPRILMQDEQWGAALKLLERSRLSRQFGANLEKHANLFIADCAERLLNPDLRLEALKRAADADPNWREGATAHAKALAATGKLDVAIAELRRLAAETPLATEDLVRLLVMRTLRLPAAQRNWGEVKGMLDDLPSEARARMSVKLLRAEVAALEGDRAAARKQMEAERDRDPKQLAPWLFLVGLEERKDPAAALAILDDAERRVGPAVDWQLARLRIAMQAGPGEAGKRLATLLKALDDAKDEDRNRLLDALASASATLADLPTARRLWRELAQRTPGNLGVWLVLFDSALGAKDSDEARTALAKIRELEAGDGPHTACSEAALLLSVPSASKETLAEVRKHLARAKAARPSWSRVPLLEATVFERERQPALALEKYKAAIDRGEGRLSVIQRTVQLMNEQGHYNEAQALLQKLPEHALEVPGLGRLAAQAVLVNQSGNDPELARKQALDLARKAVAKSTNHRDYIWLGQMAALAGEQQEAEKALRRAVELDAAAPEGWIALVIFLARNDVKQAEAELENARTKIASASAPLAVATCLEALGKLPQAEEQYQAALKDRPRDIVVLRNVAGFYGRTGQFAKAEPLLRQCLDLPDGLKEPTATWARRNLALALTFQGGYQRLQEAQALLASTSRCMTPPRTASSRR